MDRETVLRHWLENDFRNALADDEKILAAAALMKVGVATDDAPKRIIQTLIAGFVWDVIAPGETPPHRSNYGET